MNRTFGLNRMPTTIEHLLKFIDLKENACKAYLHCISVFSLPISNGVVDYITWTVAWFASNTINCLQRQWFSTPSTVHLLYPRHRQWAGERRFNEPSRSRWQREGGTNCAQLGQLAFLVRHHIKSQRHRALLPHRTTTTNSSSPNPSGPFPSSGSSAIFSLSR